MIGLGIDPSLFAKYSTPQAEDTPKIDHSFQELGVEMEAWFKKEKKNLLWSLFHKKEYSENMLREAFFACKRQNKASVLYLMGVLRRMKNDRLKIEKPGV